MGLADDTQRDAVLRTIDKFDKVGEVGVRELLGKGRLDASGAYIDGVGLTGDQAAPVVAFLTSRGDTVAATLKNLRDAIGGSDVGAEGVNELETMAELFDAGGYGADQILIDPSVVRGLGYYTGPVFEAELTFEIFDEKGRKRQFGSVSGGGRYDDLVKRFTGQAVPATGVSIGVDRLLAALREKGRIGSNPLGPVVVTVMDRDRMADYQAMVTELRNNGIRSEVYLGNPKNFSNQLKYADKRNSPIAIIEGGDEKDQGIVQIKDLILGAQIAQNATLEEWKERPTNSPFPVIRCWPRCVKFWRRIAVKPRGMTMNPKVITTAAGLKPCSRRRVQPRFRPRFCSLPKLLDLYGEDIRARAYVTSDPLRGEKCCALISRYPLCRCIWNRGQKPRATPTTVWCFAAKRMMQAAPMNTCRSATKS